MNESDLDIYEILSKTETSLLENLMTMYTPNAPSFPKSALMTFITRGIVDEKLSFDNTSKFNDERGWFELLRKFAGRLDKKARK